MKDVRFEFLESITTSNDIIYPSRRTSIWQSIMQDKSAVFAGIILLILIIISNLAFLFPYDPNEMSIQEKLLPPSTKHWFGTDDYGRDYFTRILNGGQISLTVGFVAMVISIIMGVIVGTISGYIGGKVDSLLMRFLDVFMALPSFFLILILSAFFKLGIINIILIIGLLSWMDVARIVRAETLTLKKREYVLYSHATGEKTWKIILKHIVPGIVPSVIVASAINIANAIMTESALSFLGLGIQQPDASWGSMLYSAQGFIGQASYLSVIPGLLILIVILAFNVLGNSLQRVMEHKE